MRRRELAGLGTMWMATGLFAGQMKALPRVNPAKAADIPSMLAGDDLFPLKPSGDGRYLVDQRQRTFFIVGDSAQGIYSEITQDEVGFYLQTRAENGFNTLLAEPLFYGGNGSRVRPSADGHLPFLRSISGGTYDGAVGTADFSAPNPAYWNYVCRVLDQARQHRFLVAQYALSWGPEPLKLPFLAMLERHTVPERLKRTEFWSGLDRAVFGEPGGCGVWLDVVNSHNTESVCYGFGQWLGERFRDYSNLIWLDGNDFSGNAKPVAPDGTSGIQRSLAFMRGMRAAGARQLRSGDWAPETVSTDQADFAAFMDLNGVYTYGRPFGSTYTMSRHGYSLDPPKPTYLKETVYEGADALPGDAASVRKCQWWSILSGATAGLIFGHSDVCLFVPGRWKAALDSTGAHDMTRMAGLINSLAWHGLVPSELEGMRRLVVSRNGAQVPAIPDYVAAAQTQDGTLLLAYVPPWSNGPQHLDLDLRSMRKPLRARWWDPTSARFSVVAERSPDSVETFTTPGTNHAGSNDWVLVLDAATGSDERTEVPSPSIFGAH
jgi:hypothetical protein